MSILNGHESTQAEKLYDIRNEIKTKSNKVYNKLLKCHTSIFNTIWFNEDETIDAQDVFDEYGVKAEDLFTFSTCVQNILLDANPEYISLVPPLPYTINEDGTVTVDVS